MSTAVKKKTPKEATTKRASAKTSTQKAAKPTGKKRIGKINAKHAAAAKAAEQKAARLRAAKEIVPLHAGKLDGIGELVHAFSTRFGGSTTVYGERSLNLGFTASDTRKNVEKNRRDYFATVGAGKMKLVRLKQIHSDIIHTVTSAPKEPLNGDGVITNTPGLLLSVLTADCIPVIVVDPRNRAIGIFHAGWRGTAKRIVEKGIGMMRAEFGSHPSDMLAAIGPGIGQCCYAVGEEVINEFESQFAYSSELFREQFEDDPIRLKYPLLFLTARAPGHSNLGPETHLDLVEANRRQLVDAGLQAKNIDTSQAACTGCDTARFFSHRKEDGFTGRMMAVVGYVEEECKISLRMNAERTDFRR